MRTFRSDNNAGLCPEALEAAISANDGAHYTGYGDDPYTAEAVRAFRGIFGADASVWLLATGTAANTLAVASLTRPWQQVICHGRSHYAEDESTAPERITGCRTVAIDNGQTKLGPDDLLATATSRGDVHQPQPGVITISNPTEFGTVYTPEETTAICETARAMGCRVHVDGARFANAVAHLGCDPRDLSSRAGVDALSFGGTKNGMAAGEALLFFPQGDGAAHRAAVEAMPFHRKATGHLLSKHRFIAAPFAAVLREGIWLRHAAHANTMAQRLAEGLAHLGIRPAWRRESNAVFAHLPEPVDNALRAAGHGYYPFGPPAQRLSRLMCAFDTQPEEIDAFVSIAARAGEVNTGR